MVGVALALDLPGPNVLLANLSWPDAGAIGERVENTPFGGQS
jgi:hypothetical protein